MHANMHACTEICVCMNLYSKKGSKSQVVWMWDLGGGGGCCSHKNPTTFE